MQGNKSITIPEISFPLDSDLDTNAKLCQTKSKEDFILLSEWLMTTFYRLKLSKRCFLSSWACHQEIRGPNLFSPHKQLWMWGVLL